MEVNPGEAEAELPAVVVAPAIHKAGFGSRCGGVPRGRLGGKTVSRCGDEVTLGRAKESVTASKAGRVALAAEVAEKSGAALSVSKIGLAAWTCACVALTLPSSNHAHTHTLFMMRLSEGCPTLRQPHRYGKQRQRFCLRSFASGDKGKQPAECWAPPGSVRRASGCDANNCRSCSASLPAEGRRYRGRECLRWPRLRGACSKECTGLRRRAPRSPGHQWQTSARLPGCR